MSRLFIILRLSFPDNFFTAKGTNIFKISRTDIPGDIGYSWWNRWRVRFLFIRCEESIFHILRAKVSRRGELSRFRTRFTVASTNSRTDPSDSISGSSSGPMTTEQVPVTVPIRISFHGFQPREKKKGKSGHVPKSGRTKPFEWRRNDLESTQDYFHPVSDKPYWNGNPRKG